MGALRRGDPTPVDSLKKLNLNADCSDEALDELLAFAHAHSPVCETLCRPVPVVLEREVAGPSVTESAA